MSERPKLVFPEGTKYSDTLDGTLHTDGSTDIPPVDAETYFGTVLNTADRVRQEGVDGWKTLSRAEKKWQKERDDDIEAALAAAIRLDDANRRAAEAEKEKAEALEKSLKDPLTGCYNRGYFADFAKETFDPIRDEGVLGLVYVDVNYLRETNNTFGHDKGDEVIISLVDLMKSGGRKSETTVVRIGGDEFVIIVKKNPNDDNEQGASEIVDEDGSKISFEDSLELMMERITSEAEVRNNALPQGEPPLSFAYGIAVYHKALDSTPADNPHISDEVKSLGYISPLSNTLNRADVNMYTHKKDKKATRTFKIPV